MADIVGRRVGIMSACVVFCLGVGLQLDTKWGAFIAGRVIAGLGVGMVSVLCPMYMTETSPKAVRGFVIG
jgi:SP family sugar:H+ symporter-like MFS transporter